MNGGELAIGVWVGAQQRGRPKMAIGFRVSDDFDIRKEFHKMSRCNIVILPERIGNFILVKVILSSKY